MTLHTAIRATLRSDAYGVLAGASAGTVGVTASLLAHPATATASAATTLLHRLVVFCITTAGAMALYNADRWIDRDADLDRPERRDVWASSRSAIASLIVLPYAVSLLLLLATAEQGRRLEAGTLYVALGLFGLLYSLKPQNWTRRFGMNTLPRIKQIPLAKCFYVPTMWAITASLVPSLAIAGLSGSALGSFGIYLFMRVFAGATASDIRDKDSDQAAGVITFPVAYGIANTIAGIQVLNLLSILWLLLAIQLHWLPLPALALLVSNGLGLRAWNRLRRGRTSCRAVLLLAYLETLTMPLLVAIGALIAHLGA